MQTIRSRELKSHLGEVLRHVREGRRSFAVTQRGRIVAQLVPAGASVAGAATMPSMGTQETGDFETLWAELDELAEEIGREWPGGLPADRAVSADRREL